MAKKKSKSQFGMAQAIRDIIGPNPGMSAKDTLAAIQQQHPETPINEKSFGVAFYNARKALGISSPGAKKTVRKKKPAAATTAAASSGGVDLAQLQAAARFLGEVGTLEAAIAAIKQVQALQVK